MSHTHTWQLVHLAEKPLRSRIRHPEGFMTDDEEQLVGLVRSYRCASCPAIRQDVERVAAGSLGIAAGTLSLGPVRSVP